MAFISWLKRVSHGTWMEHMRFSFPFPPSNWKSFTPLRDANPPTQIRAPVDVERTRIALRFVNETKTNQFCTVFSNYFVFVCFLLVLVLFCAVPVCVFVEQLCLVILDLLTHDWCFTGRTCQTWFSRGGCASVAFLE